MQLVDDSGREALLSSLVQDWVPKFPKLEEVRVGKSEVLKLVLNCIKAA